MPPFREPTGKPKLDDRLIAWMLAFQDALDEMVKVTGVKDPTVLPTPLVEVAATVAAQLVVGADLSRD